MSNEKGAISYLSGYGISSPKAYGFYKVTASKFTNLKD